MKTSGTIRMRCSYRGEHTEVRIFIRHPMETGARHDPLSGELLPLHHITEVECSHAGQRLLQALWGRGVARNPFLRFNSKRLRPGDEVQVNWRDNLGNTGQAVGTVRDRSPNATSDGA